MIIGTVVEGPTDRLVLQAVLSKLIPGQHRYLPLQPTPTLGEMGSGWKGVRRWCRETCPSQGRERCGAGGDGKTRAPLRGGEGLGKRSWCSRSG